MRLSWTERARLDLIDIGRFIAEGDPGAAWRWVERLQARARMAARMPGAGRKVPELGREDIREVVERGYRIVYLVTKRDVRVLTVFESHRLLRLGEGELDEKQAGAD
ncbi:MAG: type II toxin-antitoxin system RelE/ParE family toxin [Thermoanaerobaculia bacterium]|nr:type II toxin-antitoxin system RelE/ParE family toxin [Thermoanaerobaculia bacterium]